MSFTFDFTRDKLKQLFPRNYDIDEWYEALVEILPLWDITTPERVAGFLAQTGHESSNFSVLSENLNYSATRLNEVFPKYFARAGRDANLYNRNPEKIANVVYANRMGNGNEASGDGWKFRGRGIIQLTGKSNYQAFADTMKIKLDEAINYVETKKGAINSACWFWDTRNLNSVADQKDIYQMTRLINGGTHGLEDRKARYDQAMQILTNEAVLNPFIINRSLMKGSKGRDVELLQSKLGLVADGDFGANTEQKLKEWQLRNGLTSDGVAGPKTLGKLLG